MSVQHPWVHGSTQLRARSATGIHLILRSGGHDASLMPCSMPDAREERFVDGQQCKHQGDRSKSSSLIAELQIRSFWRHEGGGS